ncbi:MAG: LamG domain-containing protein [Saprospiraceae bacterium]
MKGLLYFSIFVFALFLISCSQHDTNQQNDSAKDCIPSELQQNVIAFYPFTEGDIKDYSGYDNDLNNPFMLSSVSDRFGNSSSAIEFDNSDDSVRYLVDYNTDFLQDLQSLSISLWYYPEGTDRGSKDYECLIQTGDGGNCPNHDQEWSMGLYDCRQATFKYHNAVWANAVTSEDVPEYCTNEIAELSNKWHHIVVVHSANTNKLYFDGVLNDINESEGCCCHPDDSPLIENMYIGQGFTGKIDDVIIFDKELSDDDVTSLYEATSCKK